MGLFTRKVQTKRTVANIRRKRTHGILALFVIALLLCALFILLLYKPFVRIQTITVSGVESLHAQDIAQDIQSVLAEKSLWVIPRATWLTLPRSELRSVLLSKYSRIEELDLRVQDFSNLHVTITEWDPEYLWCGYIGPDQASLDADDSSIHERDLFTIPDAAQCLYVDQSGMVFAEAPTFSLGVYDMFYTTQQEKMAVQINDRVLEEEYFARIRDLRDQMQHIGVQTGYVVLESHDDIRLGIDSINGQRIPNAILRSNLGYSNADIIETIALTLQHENFIQRFSEQPNELEYIDVRFDGKILFRFR